MCQERNCLCRASVETISARFFNLFNTVFTIREERGIEHRAKQPPIDPKTP